MISRIDFEKLSAYPTPDESPGYLLWRVSSLWRREIEAVLKPLGLTHPQFVILAVTGWLGKEGQHASQAEISRNAGMDPNTVSQVLRALQTKKLIKRPKLADERSKHPSLTASGSRLLAKALPAVEKADAKFFAKLDLRKISILEALRKLASS